MGSGGSERRGARAHAATGVTNWAGNIAFQARRLRVPSCVEELQELVAASSEVRAFGTGHSFNAIADTRGVLVSARGLPPVLEIDARAGAVTVSGGTRFGEFTGDLHEAGLALHNLGSLSHISVAGACATGTHGSGTRNGVLASAVRAVEFVAANGELVTLRRGEEAFAGAVVSLGALGVVTRLTIDTVPAYGIRQWVYEGLPHRRLLDRFDEVMSAAYSVSLFTDWRGEQIPQVWLKQRTDSETGAAPSRPAPSRWLGAELADGPRHPVPGMPPEHCTQQQGLPGPWNTRLPHFRLEFTPSSGEELQSEYFVGLEHAAPAFEALYRIRERIAPVLQISEIRTVADDDLWLSPAHRRDTVAFHFTWVPEGASVRSAVRAVEESLAPFGARPHWGKVFGTSPEVLRGLYERYADFERLAARFDPGGKFRNEWTERCFPAAHR